MMRTFYSALHPLALAVAGGVAAIVLALVAGVGMVGAGSMMGGGSMMGTYGYPGYHMTAGAGIAMLLWAFIAGALAGWIVALVYNAMARPSTDRSDLVAPGPSR
jgi:hypothetical protein